MPNLATWMRPKDEKWFRPFFAKQPELHVFDARNVDVSMDQMDGLLLTGGSDITPEFLRQENVDPNLIDKDDLDPRRDGWEFDAISKALKRGCRFSPFAGVFRSECRFGRHAQARYSGSSGTRTKRAGHSIIALRRQGEASIRKCKQFTSSGDRSARRRFRSRSLVRPTTMSSSKCACVIIPSLSRSNTIPSAERFTTLYLKISLRD
jgi:hypothetical protein